MCCEQSGPEWVLVTPEPEPWADPSQSFPGLSLLPPDLSPATLTTLPESCMLRPSAPPNLHSMGVRNGVDHLSVSPDMSDT